jgi:hypothetical protein
LSRPIVQLGTDPVQDALVQGSHSSRSSPDPFVKLSVLLQESGELNHFLTQLGLLRLDCLARLANKPRQQQEDNQIRLYRSGSKPGSPT